MKKIRFHKLPPEVQDEMEIYLNQLGLEKSEVSFEFGELTSKIDIEYWLKSKLKTEGLILDESLIESIGKSGKIFTPILLDTDLEYTIEGRHRLMAALRYGLTVPLYCLVRKNSDE
jgi:hypothetical protein